MATDPQISFQFPSFGSAENRKVGQDFADILTYIRERNNGTVAWDALTVTGPVIITGDITNTGNPFTVTSAEATTEIAINNTATDGDPYLSWQLSGTRQFSIGVNDGANDVLQLGTTAIDTGTMWQATAAGEITQPLQPSFLCLAGTAANVTGDNTVYTVTWTTEVFDQGSDFSSNTFTAPVTGRYYLSAKIEMEGMSTAGHSVMEMNIVTSNRSYRERVADIPGSVTTISLAVCQIVDMDAGDTATVTVKVEGGAKTVDVSGDSDSPFSGSLIN